LFSQVSVIIVIPKTIDVDLLLGIFLVFLLDRFISLGKFSSNFIQVFFFTSILDAPANPEKFLKE